MFKPKDSQSRFCSVTCRASSQRGPEKTCETCGKPIPWKRGRMKNRRFCSKACTDKSLVKPIDERACEECGGLFVPARTDKRAQRFCGRACGSKAAGRARRTNKLMRTPHGYLMRYMPENPMASRQGMVMEHRRLMADHLKRPLAANEVVHHINGIKDDNRLENLVVMEKSEHDSRPKQRLTEIECPHCRGRIGTSNAVRGVTAL